MLLIDQVFRLLSFVNLSEMGLLVGLVVEIVGGTMGSSFSASESTEGFFDGSMDTDFDGSINVLAVACSNVCSLAFSLNNPRFMEYNCAYV
jgi:hypothetical protein